MKNNIKKNKELIIILSVIGVLLFVTGSFLIYSNLNTEIREKESKKNKTDGNITSNTNSNISEGAIEIKYIEDSYVNNITNTSIEEKLKQKINFNQSVYSYILNGTDFLSDDKKKEALLMDYVYTKYNIQYGTYIRFETLKNVSKELLGIEFSDAALKGYSYYYQCKRITYNRESDYFSIGDPGCGEFENPYYISLFENLQSDNEYYYYDTRLIVFNWNEKGLSADYVYEVEKDNIRLCRNIDCSDLIVTITSRDYTISDNGAFWKEIFSQIELYVRNKNKLSDFQRVRYVFDKNDLTLKDIKLLG